MENILNKVISFLLLVHGERNLTAEQDEQNPSFWADSGSVYTWQRFHNCVLSKNVKPVKKPDDTKLLAKPTYVICKRSPDKRLETMLDHF